MNQKLNAEDHLKQINKKIAFISYKLLPFMLQINIKFNNNLYEVFIEPHYRLMETLYQFMSNKEKETLEIHRRTRWKRFVMVPIGTPNKIVYRYMKSARERFSMQQSVVDQNAYENRFRNSPANLIKLIQKCYNTKCLRHNMIINTTTYLK